MNLTRRSLIAGGTAALCWPRTLFAQKPARIARVVIANEVAEKGRASFRTEFAKHGWVDGRNLALSFVGIAGAPKEEAEARAREVIASRPDAILIIASSAMALLRRLTKDIPVVFHNLAIDPAKIGLVESLPRPGGNFTGTSHNWELMMAKAWSMLKEIRPDMKRGGVIGTESDSDDDFYEAFPATRAIDEESRRSGASRLGIDVRVVEVPPAASLGVVIEAIRGLKADALMIGVRPALHEGLIGHLTQARLPAFGDPVFVRNGGLGAMTFDFQENRNQAVTMVAAILRGASPATMPVYQGTRYGFLLNLRAARAMGLTVPASIRVQATEVIDE